MSNLYLVDQPIASGALALAAGDSDAIVVLVQDGVYADTASLSKNGRRVYAIKRDIERRGLSSRIAKSVKPIGFDELVDLIAGHKVVNFA